MTDWLNEAYRLCRPGAPICLFIDWRQLPSMTDALQRSAGSGAASLCGQGYLPPAEGPLPPAGRVHRLGLERGHAPAAQCRLPARRLSAHEPCQPHHVTEKSLPLMRDIVQICEPGGRILDPFAGAGNDDFGGCAEGYEAVGIEKTAAYYKLGSDRVKFALKAGKIAK